MRSVCVLTLLVLSVIGASRAEETPTTTAASLTTSSASTTTVNSEVQAGPGSPDKIARRIIDDRLTPPRATDFAPWNKRLPIGEVFRTNGQPPRVTEDVDDNATERAVPKKTRTVGPTQDPGCCGSGGGKSTGPNVFSDEKDKSQQQQQHQLQNQGSESLDHERGGNSGAGHKPRFHGNRPSDDRYGHGWRSSSYLGFGKDKDYYDQRNRYPYDRYSSAQRPTSGYAVDGDRYSTAQRPSSNYGAASDSDRYGSGSSISGRPTGNYQSANYGYGPYGDRPSTRPGIGGGNYGITGSIGGGGGGGPGGNAETDADYPYGEGGPPGGAGLPSNLQTQKAVALKALAGVALIGAAAALASNPVLLPISVLSGRRRKRSVEVMSDNYALTALLQGYIQPKPNEVAQSGQIERREKADSSGNETSSTSASTRQELVISPQCVARLACHVHRDYLNELEKSKAELQSAAAAAAAASDDSSSSSSSSNISSSETDETALHGLEHWFDSLIHSNILVADYLSDELKSLIQSAVAVGSNKNASCDNFSCLNVHDSSSKKTI